MYCKITASAKAGCDDELWGAGHIHTAEQNIRAMNPNTNSRSRRRRYCVLVRDEVGRCGRVRRYWSTESVRLYFFGQKPRSRRAFSILKVWLTAMFLTWGRYRHQMENMLLELVHKTQNVGTFFVIAWCTVMEVNGDSVYKHLLFVFQRKHIYIYLYSIYTPAKHFFMRWLGSVPLKLDTSLRDGH